MKIKVIAELGSVNNTIAVILRIFFISHCHQSLLKSMVSLYSEKEGLIGV